MKLQTSVVRGSLLLFAVTFALPTYRAAAQTNPDAAQAKENQSKAQPGLKPLAHDENGREAIEEGADFLKRRQEWFFKPRAFPIGFIPQGARERALQQKTQMYQREGRLSLFAAQPGLGFLPPPTGTASAWVSIGPQPTNSPFSPPFTSGRVTALAANPNNANNVYLGGADGGLWITTDGGNTWTPLTDNPPNAANIPTVAVGAVVVDPTTCGAAPTGICTTVYVGTGEDNFAGDNIYGEGVLNCTIVAGTPPSATCTQDGTFHSPSPLDQTRGGPMIGALAVNRATGRNNILLAGVRGRGSAIVSGVWCSADKGSTWTRVLPTALTNGAGDPGADVAFASDGTAWVALGFPVASTGNGIYRSNAPVTSCAINFTQQTLPAAFTASNVGWITLALAPSSDATIYAAIADATNFSANLLGVVRSINANTTTPTWTQLMDPLVSAATGFCTGQCNYDMALSVDPANPAVVYAGGSSQNPIIRTTTGTAAAPVWADVTGGTVSGSAAPHVDTHAFAFAGDGSKVWVGNDGGVWSAGTPASTISWSNLNAPSSGSSTGALNITQFYPGVSIHPSNPGFAMGGSQDNGTQVDQAATTPTTPLIWNNSGLPCDGGFTVIDPTIPSTSYGECEYVPNLILNIDVTFSGDGLLINGFLAVSGINASDRGSFIPPLVVDKTNSQTLYFGTCRVWQTKDGASSWTAISPDVTTATHPAGCGGAGAALSTIAPALSNSNTVYTGSDSGEIEVTADGGTTWISIVTATLPTRAVTEIVVDPSNAATVYAGFSGFGTCNNSAVTCDQKGHVFKTVNGTAGAATAWVDISGTTTKLPDIPVNAIVLDPADATHNTLYVGTDIGAFFTIDGGVNWSPLGAAGSMPNAQILSLALHSASRTLRAATHGRGMWDLNLGGQAAFGITSISPFTANAGASSISPFTVNGNGFTASSVANFTASGATTPLATTCATATTCTTTIPMAQLQSGALAQITVTDTGKTTNAVPFTVLNPVPGITSISPTTVVAGSSGLSLTVNGSNFVTGATLVLFNGIPLPANAVTVTSSNTLTVQVPAANLATAQVITVNAFNPQPGGGPDINATSPTLTVTAAGSSFTVGGTAATVTAGGTGSGSSTITITPTGGFTSTGVAITCGALPGVTCSALSIPVPNANAAMGTLTVNVTAPSSSMTAMTTPATQDLRATSAPLNRGGGKGWWTLSAGTGLAGIVLLLLPGRKRYRAAMGLGLICMVSFAIGCGSSTSSGGGGPVATTTHLTVSTTKLKTTDTLTVSATVTGGTPAASVQFFVDGAAAGTAAPVTGGTTGNIMLTAANAPPLFQLIGTHTLSAHYLGDANTQASNSGTLNITITGTTQLAITANPASSNANPTISLTIN